MMIDFLNIWQHWHSISTTLRSTEKQGKASKKIHVNIGEERRVSAIEEHNCRSLTGKEA